MDRVARPAGIIGRFCVIIYLVLLSGLATCAIADDYTIGPGDILQITYWQDPGLNQEVTVRQDGSITLSVVGELQASNRTTTQLEQLLVERISRVNRQISQVVVTVTQFRSRSVFVGGQVFQPGMQYFEVIPNLWEVIKLAGGPLETADLSNVTILRSADAGGGVVRTDIAEILASGELDRLPALHPGYTVTIPRLPVGLGGDQFVERSRRQKVYYIYGSVAVPGRHQLETGTDLLEALVLAGGPSPDANLGEIRIISKGASGPLVRIIDLDEYSNTGGPYRYTVQREDAIFIPPKRRGFFSGTWSVVRDLLAITGTASSLILILTR